MNKINCLHCLIKQTNEQKGRGLRIVCDWNDVMQDAVAHPLWELEIKNLKARTFVENDNTSYGDFFKKFWSEYEGGKENMYWRKDKALDNLVNEHSWNDKEYFNKIPFLSVAKELLLALKEGSIEELTFLSSYSERVHPGGDKRKLAKFEATFGQFPQVKGLRLIPASGDSKGSWLLENNPNFDMFIDDSPTKVSTVKEAFSDDSKFYVLPHYKCNEKVEGKNIYHVETTVSDLTNQDFVQVIEELKKQDKLENKQVQLPKE